MPGAFLYRNYLAETGVALSTPPWVYVPPSMPLANLYDPQPRVRARLSGDACIVVDLGAQRPLEAVFIGSTDVGPNAQWRVRFSAVDPSGLAADAWDTSTQAAATSPDCNGQIVAVAPVQRTIVNAPPLTIDDTDISIDDLHITIDMLYRQEETAISGFLLTEDGDRLLAEDGTPLLREDAQFGFAPLPTTTVNTPPVGRYLRVDVVDPSRDTIDIGILAAGPLLRPTFGMRYGMAEGRRMLDREDVNPFTGSRFRVAGAFGNPRRMTFSQPLRIFQGDSATAWRDMLDRLGAARDALWIPEVSDAQAELNRRAIWGGVAKPGGDAMYERETFSLLTRSFDLEERL